MSELNWQRHMGIGRSAQAARGQQQTEQRLIEQKNHQETYRILRIMDLVVADFLGAAGRQNFPGAQPHFVQVPGGIIRGPRQIQQGVEYAWRAEGYVPHGEPVSTLVHSGGDWVYTHDVEDRSDEYTVSLFCAKTAGQLGASQRNHHGNEKSFVLDESIPDKLMGVLAHIAVENNIQL